MKKAIDSVVKNFQGEVVLEESKQIELKNDSPPNSIKITNRPTVDFEDEDDIPF